MKKLFLILLSAFLLFGCASSVNKMMQSWMGHSAEDLIASWGPPAQVLDNPAGGKIYVYHQNTQVTLPGTPSTPGTAFTTGYIDANGNWQSTTTYTPGTPGTPPTTYDFERVRVFFVNQQGVIYRWSWRGL